MEPTIEDTTLCRRVVRRYLLDEVPNLSTVTAARPRDVVEAFALKALSLVWLATNAVLPSACKKVFFLRRTQAMTIQDGFHSFYPWMIESSMMRKSSNYCQLHRCMYLIDLLLIRIRYA